MVADQRLDFLYASPTNFYQRIYIPDGCPFVVSGSTSGSATTLTTQDPHCLSSGDTVILSLFHDDCEIISYSQSWTVTVVTPTTFSIPYDSQDCDRQLIGNGQKPKDLTGISYTGNYYTNKGYTGGLTANGTAGDKYVSVDLPSNQKNFFDNGGKIAVGANTYTVLGASELKSNGYCQELNNAILSLQTGLAQNLEDRTWAGESVQKKGELTVAGTLTISPTASLGLLEVRSSVDFNRSYSYFYEIFQTIGGTKSRIFSGDIAFGVPSGQDAIAAKVAYSPVVIANPNAINNLQIHISNVAALRAVNTTGFVQGTVRRPLGYYAATDCNMPPYHWHPGSTLDDDGGIILKPDGVLAANPGRWIAKFSGAVDLRWYGVQPGALSDQSARFQACVDACETLYEIYAPAGIYTLNTTISSAERTIIRGSGKQTVFRTTATLLFSLSGFESELTDFRIESTPDDYSQTAIRLNNRNLEISNITVVGNFEVAVHCVDVWHSSLCGLYLQSRAGQIGGKGILLDYSVNNSITASDILNKNIGIEYSGVADPTEGNFSEGVTVSNCTIALCDFGIYVEQAIFAAITTNTIDLLINRGIVLVGGRQNVISDNWISPNNSSGFTALTTAVGVDIRNTCNHNIVTSNVISGIGEGVVCAGSRCTVSNNDIRSTTGGRNTGDKNILLGNNYFTSTPPITDLGTETVLVNRIESKFRNTVQVRGTFAQVLLNNGTKTWGLKTESTGVFNIIDSNNNSILFTLPAENDGAGSRVGTFNFRPRVAPVLTEYANNAAALGAGLTPGELYRTGDDVKIVH